MHEKEEETKKIIDRNLGDEWAGWVGDLSEYEKEISEGKRLFLVVYFAALLFLTLCAGFAYYLVAPRLYELNPLLDQAVMWLVIAAAFGVYFWSLLLLLTLAFNANFLMLRRKTGLHIEWVYPVVYKIGGMFKISKDRLGHSLVKVNNALVYATRKKFKSEKLLVLLPRCLDRSTREAVMETAGRYGVTAFTATGGSSAREMVKKTAPDAIIGVACERDLVAGMADVPHNLTVIGIPNMRPEGPCKNTTIDLKYFEEAVRFLMKT